MKWSGRRESSNVESGGGMGRMATGGGIGTLVIGLVIYFLTGDARLAVNTVTQPQSRSVPAQNGQKAQLDTPERKFVAVVLADTEDVWGEIFKRIGRRYEQPKLVLFSGQVQSACGVAGTSSGPFYCPEDQKLYLDLDFFRELHARHGAPGDFAQAYVIAHEVGHHVQNQLGTLGKIQELRQRSSKTRSNDLSVRTELQADYYAGVWAHYAQQRDLLDPGDVEEALTAASAVGDDTLQQRSRGYVVPDSFTHGTSQQRATWFNRGLKSGDLNGGDTFSD